MKDDKNDFEDTLDEDEEDPRQEESWSWQQYSERDFNIARAIAASCERAGLIHPTDEFSFEWHSMFDMEIDEAKTSATLEHTASQVEACNPMSASEASSHPDCGKSIGDLGKAGESVTIHTTSGESTTSNIGSETGSGSAGDAASAFGPGFGSNCGGDFGGNFWGNDCCSTGAD